VAFEAGTADSALANDTYTRYESELTPHFATEEEVLLPALAEVGEEALVQRTREEHATLRRLVESAHRGDRDALRAFGALLNEHVRFEENELFPTCEQRLADGILDAVAVRAPKHPGPP